MSFIPSEYAVDVENEKLLKSWLTAGKWSTEEATLLFLEIDPDRAHGNCFTTFSGNGCIQHDYYDGNDPRSIMSYGVDDDGEPEYLTTEQRTLLHKTRGMCKEIKRSINLHNEAKPREWIDLAIEKGINIAWLDWAIVRGLYVRKKVLVKKTGTDPALETGDTTDVLDANVAVVADASPKGRKNKSPKTIAFEKEVIRLMGVFWDARTSGTKPTKGDLHTLVCDEMKRGNIRGHSGELNIGMVRDAAKPWKKPMVLPLYVPPAQTGEKRHPFKGDK